MGTSSSKDSGSSLSDLDSVPSGQFYVSLNIGTVRSRCDLIPHVFGSILIIGGNGTESTSTSELIFVVPPNHETLVFKFLLKPRDRDVPCFVEDREERLMINGNLEGSARSALFKLPECVVDDVWEYWVSVTAEIISPFDLAACWRTYREDLRPSTVRGIPDVSLNAASEAGKKVRVVPLTIIFFLNVIMSAPLHFSYLFFLSFWKGFVSLAVVFQTFDNFELVE
ncbi:hypothetical protein HPP92_006766 [Vanilla planifolia]|uniref:Uncharacterized protein n=1 Tax=Vanilla planifolia TaxID=51239 RepID=A0A835R987_VANPL|nr:hypothetical protein HPP92_006766 [Vanilla planifolia]